MMKHTIYIDLEECPRCGESHSKINAIQLYGTVEKFAHFCMCPTIDQPIMIDLASAQLDSLVKDHSEEIEALQVVNESVVAEIVRDHTSEKALIKKKLDVVLDQVSSDFELLKNAKSLIEVNEIISLREHRVINEHLENEVG